MERSTAPQTGLASATGMSSSPFASNESKGWESSTFSAWPALISHECSLGLAKIRPELRPLAEPGLPVLLMAAVSHRTGATLAFLLSSKVEIETAVSLSVARPV